MPLHLPGSGLSRRAFGAGLAAWSAAAGVSPINLRSPATPRGRMFANYRDAHSQTRPGDHFLMSDVSGRASLFLRKATGAMFLGKSASYAGRRNPARFELESAELLALLPAWRALQARVGDAEYELAPSSSVQALEQIAMRDVNGAIAVRLRHSEYPAYFTRRFSGPAKADWFGLSANLAKTQSEGWKQLSDIAPLLPEGIQLDRGSYLHEGDLVLDGGSLFGHPDGSEIVAVNPERSWLRIGGTGSTLRDLTLRSQNDTRRLQNVESSMVACFAAKDFTLENVAIIGGASAGIYIRQSKGGVVRNCHVSRTRADGFHVTHASRMIDIRDCTATDTGDDGFAVVSYADRGFGICSDIAFLRVSSVRSKARGLAVVGGERVTVRDLTVEESRAAGCYFFSEASYNTYGVSDCRLIGARIINAVQDRRMGNAAIQIGGRAGSKTLPYGQQLSNSAIGCRVENVIVEGSGRSMRAGLAFDPHCIGGSARNVTMRDVFGTQARPCDALQFNGRDCSVSYLSVAGVGGYLLNVGRSASGNHALERCRASGLKRYQRLTPGYILVQPAPDLEQLSLDEIEIENVSPPPARLIDRSQRVSADRVRMLRTRINGRRFDR